MMKLTCNNELVNEISPQIEVVLIKEEIADNFELQDENVLEGEEAMRENDEFSTIENPENKNDNMQYDSSLCEEVHIKSFLNRVKEETEFKIIHDEIQIKDELLFEATDSNSKNISNNNLLNEGKNKPDCNSTFSEGENINDNMQYDSSSCEEVHMENFLNRVKKETGFNLNHEEIQIKDELVFEATDTNSEDVSNNKLLNKGTIKPDCNSTFSEGGKNKGMDQNVKSTKRYKCDQCHMGFYYQKHLKKHYRVHTGERPCECTICKKKFYSSTALNDHTRTHTGEKPYDCDVCKKAYRTKTQLTVHKRTHSNERPYKCSVCHKAFNDFSHLSGHMRIHTGKKPFQCQICPYKGITSGNLKRHMKIHMGEKKFQCQLCQYKGIQATSLKNHMRTHTGEKPFTCEHCQKSFSDLRNRKRHMQAKHADKI